MEASNKTDDFGISELCYSYVNRTIEGVVYHSEVKEKEKAQRAYDQAKARGQTAGQVKQR